MSEKNIKERRKTCIGIAEAKISTATCLQNSQSFHDCIQFFKNSTDFTLVVNNERLSSRVRILIQRETVPVSPLSI